MSFRKHRDSKTMLKLLKVWWPCQTQHLLYVSYWVKHIRKIQKIPGWFCHVN